MTEAIGEFRETITLKPNFADGHIALGRALAMAGRTDEATPHYERALALLKSERQSAGKDK
jgi:Flp pilus assembly protein TadD